LDRRLETSRFDIRPASGGCWPRWLKPVSGRPSSSSKAPDATWSSTSTSAAALQQLGRGTVDAAVWVMSEAEALVLERSLRMSEPETALEQGWLLVEMQAGVWARATAGTLKSIFGKHVLPAIGDREVAHLTPDPLQRLLNHWPNGGIANRSSSTSARTSGQRLNTRSTKGP
jgi:hypothetical protein